MSSVGTIFSYVQRALFSLYSAECDPNLGRWMTEESPVVSLRANLNLGEYIHSKNDHENELTRFWFICNSTFSGNAFGLSHFPSLYSNNLSHSVGETID